MAPPPLPTTEADRFVQTVRRSKLLPSERLDALLAGVPAADRRHLDKLTEHFVQQQALTHFQIAKLKQGTWQGLVLGPYHILSPLGKGGMGSVYLAHDTRKAGAPKKGDGGKGDPALVALKVLPPKKAREEDRMLARFQREMEMCRRVDHPHLTKTYEAGEINGVYYIAMEYIRGQSLKQYVSNGGILAVPRAARLFSEIADGLMHAHERGLIHRDLKPSNIMVTPNGHAKILDLGLALAVDEELPADKKIVGGQGYVVGTMDYIAPEQVDNPTGVDGRADLYALGCSMYYALTGSPPFPGGTSIEKMKRHRTEYPDPVSFGNPTVSVEFSRVIEKLMEKDPSQRYRDAQQVRDTLRRWTAGDPETPMDVDPEQTEAEVVLELERTQGADTDFLASIPVVVFGDKAKKYSTPAAPPPSTPPVVDAKPTPAPPLAPVPEEPTTSAERRPLPAWLIVLFFMVPIFLVLCTITAVILYLVKS